MAPGRVFRSGRESNRAGFESTVVDPLLDELYLAEDQGNTAATLSPSLSPRVKIQPRCVHHPQDGGEGGRSLVADDVATGGGEPRTTPPPPITLGEGEAS